MTVPNESDDGSKYENLRYCEFLEMIGRIADMKFEGSEDEELEIHHKIEYILDDMFEAFGYKRVRIENGDKE